MHVFARRHFLIVKVLPVLFLSKIKKISILVCSIRHICTVYIFLSLSAILLSLYLSAFLVSLPYLSLSSIFIALLFHPCRSLFLSPSIFLFILTPFYLSISSCFIRLLLYSLTFSFSILSHFLFYLLIYLIISVRRIHNIVYCFSIFFFCSSSAFLCASFLNKSTEKRRRINFFQSSKLHSDVNNHRHTQHTHIYIWIHVSKTFQYGLRIVRNISKILMVIRIHTTSTNRTHTHTPYSHIQILISH